MPDVFVYVSKADAEMLRPYFAPDGDIPFALRKATANALTDLDGPQDVEVRLVGVDASENATRMQILCIASKTPRRAPNVHNWLYAWAKELAAAWKIVTLRTNLREVAEAFPLNEVGIWPTMPDGQWYLATQIPPAPES